MVVPAVPAPHDAELPAGDVTAWLDDVVVALLEGGDVDVPCGGCTACCTSAQFVHIGPDEVDTLAHVPAEVRFPAPGLPAGHVVLGYDEHGRCPMLGPDGCTIYAHRPRTCRTYDCRVYAAAGVEPDAPGAGAVAERVRQWRFTGADGDGAVRLGAVRAAAEHLRSHPGLLDGGAVGAARLAPAAVVTHGLFVGVDGRTGMPAVVEPDPGRIAEVLRRPRPGSLDPDATPGADR